MTHLYPLTPDGRLWTPNRRLAHPRYRYFRDSVFCKITRWTPPWGDRDYGERLTRLWMPHTGQRHPCDEHQLQVQARRRKVRR